MGSALSTGLTPAPSGAAELPCPAGLAALCSAPGERFHGTDRGAGSGAHEITRRPNGAVVAKTDPAPVLSPSQVRCFFDCPARWWFKYGLQLPGAEEQLARFGPGCPPGPRSQFPGEDRNPRRPGDHRRRDVSFGRPGWNRSPKRYSPRTRARETCAGWGKGSSPSTWTRWRPPWNLPPSNSMCRARSPASRSGAGWTCWTWKGG